MVGGLWTFCCFCSTSTVLLVLQTEPPTHFQRPLLNARALAVFAGKGFFFFFKEKVHQLCHIPQGICDSIDVNLLRLIFRPQ